MMLSMAKKVTRSSVAVLEGVWEAFIPGHMLPRYMNRAAATTAACLMFLDADRETRMRYLEMVDRIADGVTSPEASDLERQLLTGFAAQRGAGEAAARKSDKPGKKAPGKPR